MSNAATHMMVTAGLCLVMASWSGGSVGDEKADNTAAIAGDSGGGGGGGDGLRSRRFLIANGEGVPDYDYGDYDHGNDDGGHDFGGGGGGGHDFGGGGGGGGHDYDDWYPDFDLDDDHHHHDHDDDDHDFDFGHGYGFHHHHVWWHYFYRHDEPHLPFPLFSPFYVHRLRPIYRTSRIRSCNEWPFVCRTTLEVIQWLQCYREFLDGSRINKFHHGVPVVPVHAWKKK